MKRKISCFRHLSHCDDYAVSLVIPDCGGMKISSHIASKSESRHRDRVSQFFMASGNHWIWFYMEELRTHFYIHRYIVSSLIYFPIITFQHIMSVWLAAMMTLILPCFHDLLTINSTQEAFIKEFLEKLWKIYVSSVLLV